MAFDVQNKVSNAFDTLPDASEMMSNAFDTSPEPSEAMSNAFDTSPGASEAMSNAFDTSSGASEAMSALQQPFCDAPETAKGRPASQRAAPRKNKTIHKNYYLRYYLLNHFKP